MRGKQKYRDITLDTVFKMSQACPRKLTLKWSDLKKFNFGALPIFYITLLMILLPNKHYSGHRRVTEIKVDQRTAEEDYLEEDNLDS